MIDLPALAALAAAHPDDLARSVPPLLVGDRVFDTDTAPAIMGVVNLSLDSTYRESVATSHRTAVRKGRVLSAQGADFVDVGAESTGSDHARKTSSDQIAQLVPVVEELSDADILVSVEAYDAAVVAAALGAGARIVNLTGSSDDDAIFDLAAAYDATVLLCHVSGAHARDLDNRGVAADPVPEMREQFVRRIASAREHGVTRLMVDPGTGFGTPSIEGPLDRAVYQGAVLLQSFRLRDLGVPVCQALPHAFHLFEDQFRSAEGLFAVLASLGRCGVFRTHEVAQVRAVINSLAVLRTDLGR